MSFNKKLTEITSLIADDAIANLLDKTAKSIAEKSKNKAEKKFRSYRGKLLSKNPDNRHFWMKEDQQTSGLLFPKEKSNYLFYDKSENLKYTAKGNDSNKLQYICLYDMNNHKVAEASEKRLALRNPFSLRKEAYPIDYDITIAGKNLGRLCSVASFGTQKLKVKFNGWNIEHKPFGSNLITDHNGNTIAEISSKHFGFDTLYFLDFQNSSDQTLIVLLAAITRAYIYSFSRKCSNSAGE